MVEAEEFGDDFDEGLFAGESASFAAGEVAGEEGGAEEEAVEVLAADAVGMVLLDDVAGLCFAFSWCLDGGYAEGVEEFFAFGDHVLGES